MTSRTQKIRPRHAPLGALLIAATLLTASGEGSSGVTTPDTTLPSTGEGPVGVIAIGHSGLTGETRPRWPGQPALENSWATGTNPDVNSIYLRLVAGVRKTTGTSNTAEGGGSVTTCLTGRERDEHGADARTGDHPDDRRRPRNARSTRSPLRRSVKRSPLSSTRSSTASPESQILIVGQWGRPIAGVVGISSLAIRKYCPNSPAPAKNCNGFFDPSGVLVQETFDLLNASISAYEGEQQRRCGAVRQCRTDGGVRANYIQVEDEVSSDGNHLNVRGQASAAELVWPVVVEMLASRHSQPQPSTELEN